MHSQRCLTTRRFVTCMHIAFGLVITTTLVAGCTGTSSDDADDSAHTNANELPLASAHTVDQVNEHLHRNLKPDWRASDIINLLRDEQIEHSQLNPSDSTVRAIIRFKNASYVHRAITIVFYFDDDEKLRTYSATEIFTGL